MSREYEARIRELLNHLGFSYKEILILENILFYPASLETIANSTKLKKKSIKKTLKKLKSKKVVYSRHGLYFVNREEIVRAIRIKREELRELERKMDLLYTLLCKNHGG